MDKRTSSVIIGITDNRYHNWICNWIPPYCYSWPYSFCNITMVYFPDEGNSINDKKIIFIDNIYGNKGMDI